MTSPRETRSTSAAAVDHFAARDVDEHAARAKQLELARPDHPFGSRCVREQDEHHVAVEDALERAEGDVVSLGELPGRIRVERHGIHVEGPEQLHQTPREMAEADQADALVAQLGFLEPES